MTKRILISIAVLTAIFLSIFLYPHEIIEVPETATSTTVSIQNDQPIVPKTFDYVEIIAGCGVHFEGECAKAYSKPDFNSEVMAQLRNGLVFKVSNKKADSLGNIWYKVQFEDVRYPERVLGDWYIPQNVARSFTDVGEEEIPYNSKIESDQRIIISLSEQKLYAYEGENLVMQVLVSTGFNLTPTPVGVFKVFIKTPSRYMQAPQLNVTDYYDLPGVPWNLYFDLEGDVIHGAYWHNSFGKKYSHGCVNLPPEEAKKLYEWVRLGAEVVILR